MNATANPKGLVVRVRNILCSFDIAMQSETKSGGVRTSAMLYRQCSMSTSIASIA